MELLQLYNHLPIMIEKDKELTERLSLKGKPSRVIKLAITNKPLK